MEVTRQAKVPRIQRVAGIGVSRNHGLTAFYGSAGTAYRRTADAIGGAASNVVKRVISIEERERAAGLQSDDATELKIPPHTSLGRRCRKVCHKAVACILIGVGTLIAVVKLIDRKVDEGGEIAVINSVRIRVVRRQVEVLDALDRGDGPTVVNRIGDVVVVILKATAKRLQA